MKNFVAGILAHVDAGKTTLSEAVLYNRGVIRSMGRVDKGDAFLDTEEMEKQRGITIFSKQAVFGLSEDIKVTLLDTPGHVDFSPETERCLWVLDAAVLVVSGSDGVQGHTRTLFSLLQKQKIPTIIFVNKMDQPGIDRGAVLKQLQESLSGGCIAMGSFEDEAFLEEAALLKESLMEKYLETGILTRGDFYGAVRECRGFPVLFGSALLNQGVEEVLDCLRELLEEYPFETGGDVSARVYKITRDENGNRLTHLKVCSGTLKLRDNPFGEEKISRIRLYSGGKYEELTSAERGMVVSVSGLEKSYGGQGLGGEEDAPLPLLEATMVYKISSPDADALKLSAYLAQLSEDMPEIRAVWDEELKENRICVMGQVQLEILKQLMKDRFGISVDFGQGRILYRESIKGKAYGVGHFEPLRHYAEVHLLLQEGERGSGIVVESQAHVDELALNWQRLIMTHVLEKSHRGVLTGSPLTDVKITVLTGRAHPKHTMGGDFRQATYRAIRQGLMQAGNVLLEPYTAFTLILPPEFVGRAMTDLELKKAVFEGPFMQEDGSSLIRGRAPMVLLQDYPITVTAYSKGQGSVSLTPAGYDICHNPEEVIAERKYDPEADLRNTPDSVFCYGGAGTVIPWHRVAEHMHMPAVYVKGDEEGELLQAKEPDSLEEQAIAARSRSLEEQRSRDEYFMGYDEVLSITSAMGGSNAKASKKDNIPGWKRNDARKHEPVSPVRKKPAVKLEKYMLVDGYNVIHAFKELSALAADNLDGARGRLLDILCNYQAMTGVNLIAVFDAYRVRGGQERVYDHNNIHVVFTKEAETADAYIEKFAHDNNKKYDITVVTSDGLEQVIITGEGCHLTSSHEFEEEIGRLDKNISEYIGSLGH